MARQPLPDIPSPCIGICAMDPTTNQCLGCMRTGAEIQDWPRADTPRKLEIVKDLRERRIASGRVSATDLRPRRRRR